MSSSDLPFPRSRGCPSWPSYGHPSFRPASLGKDETLPQRLEAVFAEFPERVALVGPEPLSYAQLDQRTRALACDLVEQRLELDTPVCILAPTGPEFVTAILGVLRAGGHYLPLDVRDPIEKQAKTIAHAGCRTLLFDRTQSSRARDLGERCPQLLSTQRITTPRPAATSPLPTPTPQSRACVFYTSGSTGAPVAVPMSHGFVVADALRQTNDLGIICEDRLDLLFSPSFSASLAPLFGALLNGASLCPFDTASRGAHRIARWLDATGVTISTMSVSTLRALLGTMDAGDHLPHTRLFSVGGEALRSHDIERFWEVIHPDCVLQNAMASTETRTYAQLFISGGEVYPDPVPVGYPVWGRDVRLVDERHREVEAGQTGEIVIEARCLPSAYLQTEGATSLRFERGDNDRIRFLTGDCGRLDEEGRIVFLGRNDAIVKVRGHRVETNAVERALLRLEGTREAVVLAHATPQGTQLAAFVVLEPDVGVDQIRTGLREVLPDYALPQRFIPSSDLPRTTTDKVDRQRLRRLLAAPPPTTANETTPAVGEDGSVEVQLRAIWREILGVEVRPDDDFFACGGDSLSAIPLLHAIEKKFSRTLSYRQIQDHSQLHRLAQVIRSPEDTPSFTVRLCEGSAPGHAPVFFVASILGGADLYDPLVASMNEAVGFYVFETAHLQSEDLTIAGIAATFREEVLRLAPEEPVVVGGFSWGGIVAQELACQLIEHGVEVIEVVLIDTPVPERLLPSSRTSRTIDRLRNMPHWLRHTLRHTTWPQFRVRLRGASEDVLARLQGHSKGPNLKRHLGLSKFTAAYEKAFHSQYRAYQLHSVRKFPGRIKVFRARVQPLLEPRMGDMGWSRFADPPPKTSVLDGDHMATIAPPCVQEVGRHLIRAGRLREGSPTPRTATDDSRGHAMPTDRRSVEALPRRHGVPDQVESTKPREP